MKRVEGKDPVALCEKGIRDHVTAFEYMSEAAKLGDIDARFFLKFMYMNGEGVENDTAKKERVTKQIIGANPWMCKLNEIGQSVVCMSRDLYLYHTKRVL